MSPAVAPKCMHSPWAGEEESNSGNNNPSGAPSKAEEPWAALSERPLVAMVEQLFSHLLKILNICAHVLDDTPPGPAVKVTQKLHHSEASVSFSGTELWSLKDQLLQALSRIHFETKNINLTRIILLGDMDKIKHQNISDYHYPDIVIILFDNCCCFHQVFTQEVFDKQSLMWLWWQGRWSLTIEQLENSTL